MGRSLRPTPKAKPPARIFEFFFGKSRKKQFTICKNCGKVYLVEDGLAPRSSFWAFLGSLLCGGAKPLMFVNKF